MVKSDWAERTGNSILINSVSSFPGGFLPVGLKHTFITDSSSGIHNSALLCPVGETL